MEHLNDIQKFREMKQDYPLLTLSEFSEIRRLQETNKKAADNWLQWILNEKETFMARLSPEQRQTMTFQAVPPLSVVYEAAADINVATVQATLQRDMEETMTDGEKPVVSGIVVQTGENYLKENNGTSYNEQIPQEYQDNMKDKYFITATVNGRKYTLPIDKETYERLNKTYQNDRVEDFARIFGVDTASMDFSRIGAGWGTGQANTVPTQRNQVDFFRGLEGKEQLPESVKSGLGNHFFMIADGQKIHMNQETFLKVASFSAEDRQVYIERVTGRKASQVTFQSFDEVNGRPANFRTIDPDRLNKSDERTNALQTASMATAEQMFQSLDQQESQSQQMRL